MTAGPMQNQVTTADITAYRRGAQELAETGQGLSSRAQQFVREVGDASVLGTHDTIGKYGNPMYRAVFGWVSRCLSELAGGYDDHGRALLGSADNYERTEQLNGVVGGSTDRLGNHRIAGGNARQSGWTTSEASPLSGPTVIGDRPPPPPRPIEGLPEWPGGKPSGRPTSDPRAGAALLSDTSPSDTSLSDTRLSDTGLSGTGLSDTGPLGAGGWPSTGSAGLADTQTGLNSPAGGSSTPGAAAAGSTGAAGQAVGGPGGSGTTAAGGPTLLGPAGTDAGGSNVGGSNIGGSNGGGSNGSRAPLGRLGGPAAAAVPRLPGPPGSEPGPGMMPPPMAPNRRDDRRGAQNGPQDRHLAEQVDEQERPSIWDVLATPRTETPHDGANR